MKLMTLLINLRGFEGDLAELYEHLAKAFTDDPEAAALFSHLSLDEWEHVARVDYQRKLVRSSPEAFGEVDSALESIEGARALAARIRSHASPPSVTEAVILAWHFETSAAEAHIRTAMRHANPGTASLLDALGRADIAHLDLVETFAINRRIPISAGPHQSDASAMARPAAPRPAGSTEGDTRHVAG
jgi:hypothetical protein